MNLPLLTAEASVYQTRKTYRTISAGKRDSNASVAPATLAAHIASLEEARDYIDRMDFTLLKRRLTLPVSLGGEDWTAERAEAGVAQYKKWLFLQRKYQHVLLSPGREVDTVWHLHILDTEGYSRDTARIFGRYLHHYAYFGLTEGMAKIREVFEKTRRLFRAEYGGDLVTRYTGDAGSPTTTAADRIVSLDKARDYIERMDLNTLKQKLTLSPSRGGHSWTPEQADAAEAKYKKWLFLQRKYEDLVLSPGPPGREIDIVWHFHILDTRTYLRDTARIFGRYLHHPPDFGPMGNAASEHTRRLFRAEYGEDLVTHEKGSASPPTTAT
jgi:hypothetical protein